MLPLTSSTRPLTTAAGSGQMIGSQLGGGPVHRPPSTHCLDTRMISTTSHLLHTSCYCLTERTPRDRARSRSPRIWMIWCQSILEPGHSGGKREYCNSFLKWICVMTLTSLFISGLTNTGRERTLSPQTPPALPLLITDQRQTFSTSKIRCRTVFYWYSCINIISYILFWIFMCFSVFGNYETEFGHDYDEWNAQFLTW